MVVLLLSLLSLVTPKLFCVTDLILLQKKPLRMQYLTTELPLLDMARHSTTTSIQLV